MIEIGEKSESYMLYEDAVLYVFCLGDGWRLPTQEEYYDKEFAPRVKGQPCWYRDDPARHMNNPYVVFPVRDIKDD